MKACVRVVVGETGYIVHTKMDTLYHPDYETQEYFRELLEEKYIEVLDKNIEDAEVLIIFHANSCEYNHPLDPIEFDTELVIDQVIIMQTNYKEHWRKHLTLEYLCSSNCKAEQKYLDAITEEWEDAYGEEFVIAEDVAVY